MHKTDILTACENELVSFEKMIKDEPYQLRGILNSEALLIVAIAKQLGVKHIIESGRARGHSTNLIAKLFQDDDAMKITSIDIDNKTADAKFSEAKLKKFPNVNLIYGDSFKLISGIIRENCIVFIDGPKGEPALELTGKLLEDKRVKAVLVHDLHKNTFPRNISEIIFQKHFFTDDADFVKRFGSLDQNCWKVMENTGYKPYTRADKNVLSYGHTLGVFFNESEPYVEPQYKNYIEHRTASKESIRGLLTKEIMKIVYAIRLRT